MPPAATLGMLSAFLADLMNRSSDPAAKSPQLA